MQKLKGLRPRAEVVLVAMPFAPANLPSIQIGALTSLLAQHSIAARPLSLHLAFAAHLTERGVDLADYQRLAYGQAAIVEWVFASRRHTECAAYPGDAALVEIAERVAAHAAEFLSRAAEEIVALSPRIVGFTTSSVQTAPAVALARRIKERAPATQIVFGGACCDGLAASPIIDHVVGADIERVAPRLFGDLLAGREPRALETSTSPRTDEMPLPDYSEYFTRLDATGLTDTLGSIVEIPFEGSRSHWSAARIENEVVALARRHRHLRFRAVDRIDVDALDTLLPRLRASGIAYELSFETRANLDKPQLRALRDAGTTQIRPGHETPISLHVIRLLKWGVELGIEIVWNVAADDERMAQLVPRLVHLAPPETCIGSLRDGIAEWSRRKAAGASLRHARGPGFVVITDRRDPARGATHTLDDIEAQIYLACDAGASAESIAQRFDLVPATVGGFLDELVAEGLVYQEGGRYLALSTDTRPELNATEADVVTIRCVG